MLPCRRKKSDPALIMCTARPKENNELNGRQRIIKLMKGNTGKKLWGQVWCMTPKHKQQSTESKETAE